MRLESTERKNMAVVHFTTKTSPTELNTGNRHMESHMFCEILSCILTTLFMLGECAGIYVCYVQVAIFLVDCGFTRGKKNSGKELRQV